MNPARLSCVIARTLRPVGAAAALALGAAVPAQVTTLDDAIHVTNRIGFGGTPADRIAVLTNYASYVAQQLLPTTVPDPEIDAIYPPGTLSTTLAALQREQFVRALTSRRRLQEAMAYFWERHFNTNINRVAERLLSTGIATPFINAEWLSVRLEAQNNFIYRNNALGSFRNLLLLTTISPAMMLYLDGDSNVGCGGNQNYAREVLELYSMGPVNESTGLATYDQSDIIKAAQCLSGWRVTMPTWPAATITFTAGNHCVGTPTLFTQPHNAANTFTVSHVGNGSNQMFELIDKIAASDLTKDFICRKIAKYFLSDDGPSDALVGNMTAVWGTTGDIRAVLNVLLLDPEFTGTTHRWKRVSTPFERAIWWQRVWDGNLLRTDTLAVDIGKADVMVQFAASLGERLFQHPTPDGYPADSEEQVGPTAAITSWDHAAKVRTVLDPLFPTPPPPPFDIYPAHPTPWQLLMQFSTSTNTIAGAILTNLYGSNWTLVDLAQVDAAIALDPTTSVFLPPLSFGNPVDLLARTAIGAATAGAFVQAQLR
ncbi:MAG: DUF1800 family protein [Planctomycetes bacterium]|nr:DUF1800 family protein [Planctomycetota bacterium]